MKFSEKWLREIVDPAIDSEKLSHQLTMAGLEVDSVTKACPEFDGLFVAEVKSVKKHPSADKLQICEVDCSDKELYTIVCGAPNVKKGMRTILAKVGAQLSGKPKLKSIKLKGVESFGMLCSASEIGLGDDSDGIIELSLTEPIGTPLKNIIDIMDNIIDLSLTPNRGDCLSIYGIAREVMALNKIDKGNFITIEANSPKITINNERKVKVSAKTECPQYTCRVIENIDNTIKTPLWLLEKLRRSGLRGVNTIVDITNFVMLELGQPLHAFDNDQLKGNIEVRFPKGKEKIKLLNETEIEINTGTLLIADDSGPLAMAGIMGGFDSAVNEKTKNILLESAFFKPEIILGEARRYGLHSDSSHRFERGVDPQLQKTAIDRATSLIQEICGGKAGPTTESKNEKGIPKNQQITLRESQINRTLGIDLDEKFVTDTFSRLGMTCEYNKEQWLVTAPSYRFDISLEADLIEELARVYGYDLIATKPLTTELIIKNNHSNYKIVSKLREVLVNRDYQEVITYSFVDPNIHCLLNNDGASLELVNPIAPEYSEMRTTLLPGLVFALQRNIKRQKERVRLFETGLVFTGDKVLNQVHHIGGIIYGNIYKKQWDKDDLLSDFYDVKCDLEVLLSSLVESDRIKFVEGDNDILHPGQRMNVYIDDVKIGYFGQLHPNICSNFEFIKNVYAYDLNIESLVGKKEIKYKKISKFPTIRRDISVVVDEQVKFEEISKCIKKDASELLVNLELFDLYRGEGIEKGKKSLALGLTFQSIRSTLKDTEVENNMHTVIRGLSDRLNAKLRE